MKNITAKLFLIAIVFVWATIIYKLLPLYVVAGVLALTSERGKSFNMNLWMLSDIMVNVILSGFHKTTVSAEIGNLAISGSRTGRVVETIVNAVWYIATREINHCRAVIEPEDKFTFDAKYAVIGFTVFTFSMYFPYVETLTKLINPFY